MPTFELYMWRCARQFAEMGLRMFPLERGGKRPAIIKWKEKATSCSDGIDAVFCKERPPNLGVTGGTFLDIDIKNGIDGHETLFSLAPPGSPTSLEELFPGAPWVRTPSGGTHVYFKSDSTVRNSTGKLGPGLDIRGVGGYVVGPGSSVGGKDYLYKGLPGALPEKDARLPDMPEWLATLARKPVSKGKHAESDGAVAAGVTVDSVASIERALGYLLIDAPRAVEGCAGDTTTYVVANVVKDVGISELKCFELMAEAWNPSCVPPWSLDELRVKVANAYLYGTDAIGAGAPEAEFTVAPPTLSPVVQTPEHVEITPNFVTIPDAADVEPRQWVLGTMFLKGAVSVLVAPPGGSKSTLCLLAALAVVTGREDLMGMHVHGREKVWIYNNEDDVNESRLRLAAATQHHGISPTDMLINGKSGLAINSGDVTPLVLAKRDPRSGQLVTQHARRLTQQIIEHGIGVLIIDPFAETHQADENSNQEIGQVARWCRAIAKRAGCAVIIVHHTNKPAQFAVDEARAGSMHTARGASALVGVARVSMTLEPMGKKVAAEKGVAEEDRWTYVRLDGAKANLSPTKSTSWFRRVSRQVATAETNKNMKMESVGVLEVVDFAPKTDDVDKCFGPEFVDDVWDVLDFGQTTVFAIAKTLTRSNPMYAGVSRSTMERRIIDAFSTPVVRKDQVAAYMWGELADGQPKRCIDLRTRPTEPAD